MKGISRERADFLLAWKQFKSSIPTEEKAVKFIIRTIHPCGRVVCGDCGHTNKIKDYQSRTITCERCRNKIWLTAGTFFSGIRNFRPWLGAIFLMESGVAFSASDLRKVFPIAASTAWSIVQKLCSVILGQLGSESVGIPSDLFLDLVCRRTKVTPARAHPRREEEEALKRFNNERNEASITTTTNDADLCGLEKEVYECLSSEPIQFEALQRRTGLPAGELSATLMLLEMAGVVRDLTGNRFVRCPDLANINLDDSIYERVITIIAHVKRTYRGISRKYLQHYLAAYWCVVDRIKWHHGLLLQACLNSPPICRAKILAYESPTLVKIAA